MFVSLMGCQWLHVGSRRNPWNIIFMKVCQGFGFFYLRSKIFYLLRKIRWNSSSDSSMASYPIGSFYGNIGVKSFPALSSAWAYLCAPRSDFKRSQTLQHLPSLTLEVNPRHPERHVCIRVQMHSSCPTSCPEHLSQTLTINPTGEEFDGSSELKVSSVIIDLSNKEKNIPLPSVCHFGEGDPPGNLGSFRRREGKLEDPASVSQEEDWKTRLSATFYTLSSPAVSIWLLPRCQCVRALFQGSRDVLWSKQKESAYCLWITSLPKSNKGLYFHRKLHFHFSCIWLPEQRQ